MVSSLKENNDLDQAFIGEDYYNDYSPDLPTAIKEEVNIGQELQNDENAAMLAANSEQMIKSEFLMALSKKEQEAHTKDKTIFQKTSYHQMMDNLNKLCVRLEEQIKIKKPRNKKRKNKKERSKK